MKKIITICVGFILFLWFAMFLASCTTVRYVYIDPKDSTKLIEVRKRIIYDDTYLQMPIYFNYWNTPYYNYSPRIVVPINPNIHYIQSGRGRQN